MGGALTHQAGNVLARGSLAMGAPHTGTPLASTGINRHVPDFCKRPSGCTIAHKHALPYAEERRRFW